MASFGTIVKRLRWLTRDFASNGFRVIFRTNAQRGLKTYTREKISGDLCSTLRQHAIDIGLSEDSLTHLNLFFDNFDKNDFEQEPEKVSPNVHLVSFSGFGYSGTTAVIDFLKGYEGVHEAFGGRELDILKYKYSLGDLYRSLLSGKKLTEQDILKFIMLHIFGVSPSRFISNIELREGLVASKSMLQTSMMFNSDRIRNGVISSSVSLSLTLLSDCRNQNLTTERFVYVCQLFFTRILSLFCVKSSGLESSGLIIVNNWIPAQMFVVSDLLPTESVKVVVHRDPWDSIIAWYRETRSVTGGPIGVLLQLYLTRARYLKFSTFLKTFSKTTDCKIISFERFVQSKSLREHLLRYFNLKIEKQTPSAFDPNQSMLNIGISEGNKNFIGFLIFWTSKRLRKIRPIDNYRN